jgi:hypothetical protein
MLHLCSSWKVRDLYCNSHLPSQFYHLALHQSSKPCYDCLMLLGAYPSRQAQHLCSRSLLPSPLYHLALHESSKRHIISKINLGLTINYLWYRSCPMSIRFLTISARPRKYINLDLNNLTIYNVLISLQITTGYGGPVGIASV